MVRRGFLFAMAVSVGLAAIPANSTTAAVLSKKRPSARTYAIEAAAALTAAKSVRLTESTGTYGTADVNVEMFANHDLVGTFIEGSSSLDIESVKNSIYLHAPASYWESKGLNHEMAQLMAPLWLAAPNASSSAQLTDNYKLSRFASMLTAIARHKPTLRKAKTIDGVAAVGVTVPRGGTWWIAVTAPHRPVLFVNRATRSSLTFSQWNALSVPQVPQNAKSLSSL